MSIARALDEQLKQRFEDHELATAAFARWLVSAFSDVAAADLARAEHEQNLRAQHKRLTLERIANHPNFKALKKQIEETL